MSTKDRVSVYVEGFSHKNPIPAACNVRGLVMSGSIQGTDPQTGVLAQTLESQCEFMLANVKRIVEAAGGSTDDIVKLTVWMTDRSQRGALNKPWLALFPDPDSRPARHTIECDLDNGKLVECDFTANLATGG